MPALKKTYFISTILLVAVLSMLLLLGLHQYRLYGQYKKIIGDTERLLLQYGLVREQIVESLIEGNTERLYRQAREIESIHESANQLLENTFIPDSYKLSFLQQVDLPGVMLLLRNAHEGKVNANNLQQINKSSRYIDERLKLFERLINGHIQKRLIGFQSMLIGVLAIIVASFIVLLLLSYRSVVLPVSLLAQRIKQDSRDNQVLPIPGKWQEVDAIISRLNVLHLLINEKKGALERIQRLSSTCQQVMKSLQSCENREDFFTHLCRALMANSDYYLAWVGIQDREDGGLLPVAADGSRVMNGEQCREGMSVLLSAADANGWKNDPAFQALSGREPIVKEDILAKVPKGPFKDTPLASHKVTSLSLPLMYADHLYGVLTIYMVARETVSEIEKAILVNLSACLAEKLYVKETMQALGQNEELGYDLATSDALRLQYNAVLGELTYGLAHEITDLNNGIINYAQLLSDELGSDPGHAEVLARIMGQGEKVADLVKPLLAEGGMGSVGEGCRCVAEAIDEVIALMHSQLRGDGIVAASDVPVNLMTRIGKKILKTIFLLLLNNFRKQAFVGHEKEDHEAKVIKVTGYVAGQNDAKYLFLTMSTKSKTPLPLEGFAHVGGADASVSPVVENRIMAHFAAIVANAAGVSITGPSSEGGELFVKMQVPLV